MDHLVSSFCIGKYAPLAEYFENITVLDLTKLDRHEIIHSFPTKYSLLIQVFLKDSNIEKIIEWGQVSSIAFDYDQSYEDDCDDDNDMNEINMRNYLPYEVVVKMDDANIVNLCNKITSSLYSTTNKLNSKQIGDVFSKIENKNITFIDLSWNKLFDVDFNLIVNVIKELDLDIKGISLSCNSISGHCAATREKTYKNLYYLLEYCEYIDISMNPFATVDRKDFFTSLEKDSPSLLLSLIWIPEMWVEKKDWQGMISKDLQYEVRDLHRRYYRWIKTLPLD